MVKDTRQTELPGLPDGGRSRADLEHDRLRRAFWRALERRDAQAIANAYLPLRAHLLQRSV